MSYTLSQQRVYERRRRAVCRASGQCVTCTHARRKPGLAPNGQPYVNCARCINRHAKVATAGRRLRLRRGYCASCPRKRPAGDRHYECPGCRRRRNVHSRGTYTSAWRGVMTFHVERPVKLCTSGCGRPRDVGYDKRCRLCRNAAKAASRVKHSALSPEQRKRANCRSYTNVLIARGELIPQPCEDCGATSTVEAHHDDYDKPREVRWKCRSCHRTHHDADASTLCGHCHERERRPGQWDCHACHAAASKHYRDQRRAELERLRAIVHQGASA